MKAQTEVKLPLGTLIFACIVLVVLEALVVLLSVALWYDVDVGVHKFYDILPSLLNWVALAVHIAGTAGTMVIAALVVFFGVVDETMQYDTVAAVTKPK
jgi:hypothetical protein